MPCPVPLPHLRMMRGNLFEEICRVSRPGPVSHAEPFALDLLRKLHRRRGPMGQTENLPAKVVSKPDDCTTEHRVEGYAASGEDPFVPLDPRYWPQQQHG